MKTPEELKLALEEVSKEAVASGFVFCASLNTGERTMVFTSGNRLTSIGMMEMLYKFLIKEIENNHG